MFVHELIHRDVITVPRDCTLRKAAQQMLKQSVGLLVIAESPDARPLGVLTDRDIVAAIARGLDPERAPVHSVGCGPRVRSVRQNDEIWDVTSTMSRYGIRRLPVVDDAGHLVGIVTLDDLVRMIGQQMSDLAGAISAGIANEHQIPSAAARRNEQVQPVDGRSQSGDEDE